MIYFVNWVNLVIIYWFQKLLIIIAIITTVILVYSIQFCVSVLLPKIWLDHYCVVRESKTQMALV